ncbi:MAG: hypothetical protein O9324_14975 [Microcystis sp. LE19-84.1B]|nr:hypothetical protein [Microcystis sp. LE19-84.1B]MCZ8225209.1 hypothetical protein [Microcystis sp. LE19-84.1B]
MANLFDLCRGVWGVGCGEMGKWGNGEVGCGGVGSGKWGSRAFG